MKNTFKWFSGLLFTLVLGLIGIQAHATIVITPSVSIPGTGLGPSNCEAGCVYDAFGLTNDGSLVLRYKSDEDGDSTGTDSGSFASNYNTTFSNPVGDPGNALIEYVSGASITCPDCYLAIKDGNQDPSYYFYNLSAWDGIMDLDLQDFWPQQGAISHVSIWGRDGGGDPSDIPEPVSLLLLSAGLMSLAFIRRRSLV
tara:strand:+ start:275 stop:868 length:594 start_codon:yes stop_codon:yes gene_type:complete